MKKKKIREIMQAAGWVYEGKEEPECWRFRNQKDDYTIFIYKDTTLPDIMRVVTDNVRRQCTVERLETPCGVVSRTGLISFEQ